MRYFFLYVHLYISHRLINVLKACLSVIFVFLVTLIRFATLWHAGSFWSILENTAYTDAGVLTSHSKIKYVNQQCLNSNKCSVVASAFPYFLCY